MARAARAAQTFDSIYRACFNQFRSLDGTDSGNFILLFSDGEDNASHTSLDEAVEMCQRTNTAIYIFRAEPETGFSTGGPWRNWHRRVEAGSSMTMTLTRQFIATCKLSKQISAINIALSIHRQS